MPDATELPAEINDAVEIDEQDWRNIAFYVADTLSMRASKRRFHEQKWKEIDRQIAMEPEKRVTADGKPLSGSSWMSELELPWQAQSLEILNADARRLIFPDDRRFFTPHAMLEDKVLKALETDDIVAGFDSKSRKILDITQADRGRIDQGMMNEIVYGAMAYCHGLYDMRGSWDLVNGEAFKYGAGVGRARRVELDKFSADYRGVYRNGKRFPVFVPRSIWNTYLDTECEQIMHDGLMVGPSWIEAYELKIDDLKLAAAKGSSDPTDENGGWQYEALKDLEPAARFSNNVWVYEYEGDLLIPRNMSRALFIPNVMVSVVVSRSGPRVFRYREREYDFRSYINVVYHRPDVRDPYGDSPLLMGSPTHKAGTDMFNMMQDSAALNVSPPVTYPSADPELAATGGPRIAPGENIPVIGKIEALKISDPAVMMQLFAATKGAYSDVTQTNPPRLGQETKSHQTRFAIDTEQTRGMVRTVDFVTSVLWGPMTTWLNMDYQMMRESFGGQGEEIFMPGHRTWLKLRNRHFPERVFFDAHGVAGPIDKREREVKRQQSIAFALNIEELRLKTGGKPMDYEQLQRILFEDAEMDNVDELYGPANARGAPQAGAAQAGPAIPGAGGGAGPSETAQIISLARSFAPR